LASFLDWDIFDSELLWRCVIIRWWCMLLLQQKVNRFYLHCTFKIHTLVWKSDVLDSYL